MTNDFDETTDSHDMNYGLLKPCSYFCRATLIFLALTLISSAAQALPNIKDQWHFFCGPTQVNDKLLQKARSKTGGGGLKAGIAQLNYACLLELREIQDLQEKFTKWTDSGQKGPQPQLDNRGSTRALSQAVATLAASYKSAPNNPKVLYHYALALAVKGNVLTVNIFDELMTKHKNDKFIGDAYLILGDHYFERRDTQKAFREYTNALKRGRPLVQAYTRYKMAWINFASAQEQKNNAKQIKTIQDLVNLKRRLDSNKGKREKLLAETIEDDVAELLARQGNLEETKRILKAMNADDVYANVLERMANNRLASNDLDGAYQFFALSLKEGPGRREALQIATTMVQIAAQKNDAKRLSEMLRYMVGNFTRGKTPWRNSQNGNKSSLTKAESQVENLVFEYAVAIDNQARQSNDQAMLTVARGLYEIFIKSFKKSRHLLVLKTQYGTLLYLQKNNLNAAKVLHDVLAANPKNKTAKDLAALMVTAAQLAVDNDKTKYDPIDPGTPKDEKPRPIPLVKKVFADSLDMFSKLNPTDTNVPAMTYTSAAIYFDFGHFEEGLKRLNAYINKYPANDFSKLAAAKVLTYYLQQNDKKRLNQTIEKLTINPTLGDAAEVKPLLIKAKDKLKNEKPNNNDVETTENDEQILDAEKDKSTSDNKDKKNKKKNKKKKKSDSADDRIKRTEDDESNLSSADESDF